MSRQSLQSALAVWMALPLAAAGGALAQSPTCGSETTGRTGETLTEVAERCDVEYQALVDANPGLPVGEEVAGREIDMPGLPGGNLLGRARQAVQDAAGEVERAATEAGQSASDFLSENPDLNRDILEFGERLGLPGVESRPEVGAGVVVTPASAAPGEEVTIRATGLQGEIEAEIGVGPPQSEFEVIARAETDSAGRLETNVTIPEWADANQPLVFVVETERVRLTSERFEVAAAE